MTNPITPVVLAGGAGTRLWPVSRDSLPKQFQRLVGPLSTYQQTLKRVADPARFRQPVVMTNAELRFFAENQASDVGAAVTVLLEPERRNSAPALAAAAAFVAAGDPGALVLALAADHVILDDAAFLAAVDAAAAVAAAGDIVTFGMAPPDFRIWSNADMVVGSLTKTGGAYVESASTGAHPLAQGWYDSWLADEIVAWVV
jgi:mannose-1-phosphate guanylyltransferase